MGKNLKDKNTHSRNLDVIFGFIPPSLLPATYKQSRSSANFAFICFWNQSDFLHPHGNGSLSPGLLYQLPSLAPCLQAYPI